MFDGVRAGEPTRDRGEVLVAAREAQASVAWRQLGLLHG